MKKQIILIIQPVCNSCHIGRSDGQTATHEFLHNIGAKDTGQPGAGIMDKNEWIDGEPVQRRQLFIQDIKKLIQ